jgi:GxxExxY protein
MPVTQEDINKLTYKIIGAAIEVHKYLGPGLLENVYLKCSVKELSLQSLDYKTQVFTPIEYKGFSLDTELRLDVLVDDQIIVEIKAIDGLLPVHEAQLLTYMKLINKPKGILINFNCVNIFKEGQKTMVNELFAALPKA